VRLDEENPKEKSSYFSMSFLLKLYPEQLALEWTNIEHSRKSDGGAQ